MAEDGAEAADTLRAALTLLVNLGRVLLDNGKQQAAASLQEFVPYKITTMFGLISAGTDCFKSIGVTKKSEAEAKWQKSYHIEAIRDQVEELLQLQTEWDSFLQHVDEGLNSSDGQLSGIEPVDRLSAETELMDGRSGKSVTLGQFLGQGQKVLLVLLRHVA